MEFLGLEVGSWADWFAAIGTIFAVLVSLYLANKKPKPILEIDFNEVISVFDGYSSRKLMSWDIKNYSIIPTQISLVGAFVSENKNINKKAKNNHYLILKPRDIFRTHKIPIDIAAYGVDTIIFEFEGFQDELEAKKEWKSIIFFCQDNFGKKYYSKTYQTSEILERMKSRTEFNSKQSA